MCGAEALVGDEPGVAREHGDRVEAGSAQRCREERGREPLAVRKHAVAIGGAERLASAAQRACLVAPGVEQIVRIVRAHAGRAHPSRVVLDQALGQLRAALGQAAELDDQVGDA